MHKQIAYEMDTCSMSSMHKYIRNTTEKIEPHNAYTGLPGLVESMKSHACCHQLDPMNRANSILPI